jgi:cell division inhibitor SepF
MASGIVRRAMVYLGLTDDDYEDYDAYDPEPAPPPSSRRVYPDADAGGAGYPGSGYGNPGLSSPSQGGVSPVRPIREPSNDPSNGVTINPRPSVVRAIVPRESVKVHVVAPTRFGDAQEIGDHFKENQPVVVNLQSGDRELSRRMIDFCSGVTYALGGAMDKIADQVFLLTPLNVEVSADEKRKLQERGLYRS